MIDFYIVATPIGNLKDITLRALEVLKGADLILAEDTRVTRKLLDHYDIKKEVLSYHQHSKENKIEKIIDLINNNKIITLVSDSGTPGISDPGNALIKEVLEKTNANIVPVPGPSAVTTAASICNFSMDKFLFLGFPPLKNKRKKFFEKVFQSEYPVVLYESCHRILKTLEELSQISGNFNIVVCRELTKKFETIHRGDIEKVIKELKNNPIKGEFVLVIKNEAKK